MSSPAALAMKVFSLSVIQRMSKPE
jgi:hypothetical protein